MIGAYADRRGRKPAVLLSMWLMAFSALILVVTPPYAQLGIMAPALMIVARLVQGFAIGGEMGSATAMLMEYADDVRAASTPAGRPPARALPPSLPHWWPLRSAIP